MSNDSFWELKRKKIETDKTVFNIVFLNIQINSCFVNKSLKHIPKLKNIDSMQLEKSLSLKVNKNKNFEILKFLVF